MWLRPGKAGRIVPDALYGGLYQVQDKGWGLKLIFSVLSLTISRNSDIYIQVNTDKIFKALSNPLRVQILLWLKDPEVHFPPMEHLPDDQKGKGYICVSVIQEKSGITQSTISLYLNILKEAELLSSKRIGQWTYYRRNEKTIQELAEFIGNEL